MGLIHQQFLSHKTYMTFYALHFLIDDIVLTLYDGFKINLQAPPPPQPCFNLKKIIIIMIISYIF